jgi:hypothetical protein
MILLSLVLKPYLSRSNRSAVTEQQAVPDIAARIAAGQRALAEGNFRLALKELNTAIELRDQRPDLLPREEYRRLRQLQRQSDLLAHLLSQSLQEILQQGTHLRDEEEWREKFNDYRGRTVVFEDVIRRDGAGRPGLATYVVRAGDVEARVALEDLDLFKQLPLDLPQRWLFGARLASCQREEGGTWVIRFDPDSGVLLTERDAAGACCPAAREPELLDVLKRQEEWLNR